MLSAPRTWANVERQLIAWISTHTGRPTYAETPEDVQQHLPAYQVTRSGGGQLGEMDREFDLEVDTIVRTRAELWPAVAQVETAMAGLSGNGTAEWYVDSVAEIFGAAIEPIGNKDLRRATATYRLTLRPQPPRP